MKVRKSLISESGAIMLEVVAVLSLMGLMGTMLFRQMYVRNQELHNIQMASEIRVVKDAFAAWIQAESSKLGSRCHIPSDGTVGDYNLTAADINSVRTFLPDGFLPGNDFPDSYILKLMCFERGTAGSLIDTYYGVVIPQKDILPDEGADKSTWNFRRAARVAMLIGVDGGAYDANVTDNDVYGPVGTWSLQACDDNGVKGILHGTDYCDNNPPAVYIATTGTDVFKPEIEMPPINVGLGANWDLALRDLTSYGKFMAGAPQNCYSISADRRGVLNNATGVFELQSDRMFLPGYDATCYPAFYVKGGDDGNAAGAKATGDVYILNDLHVGHDYGDGNPGTEKSAIRFDKNGMIVFEKATIKDPQESNKETNYILDPQYTSVMNDVKIMSRGGANLSDLLPNYILKEVIPIKLYFGGSREQANGSCAFEHGANAHGPGNMWCAACQEACTVANASRCVAKQNQWSCPGDGCPSDLNNKGYNVEVEAPQCPEGYTPAMTIIQESPGVSFNKSEGNLMSSLGDNIVGGVGKPTISSHSWVGDDHTHGMYVGYRDSTVDRDVVIEVAVGHVISQYSETKVGGKITNWVFKPFLRFMQAENENETQDKAYMGTCIGVEFKVHTYCVYNKDNFVQARITEDNCKKSGWTWETATSMCYKISPTSRSGLTTADCKKIQVEGTCELVGCRWDSGNCTTP